MTTHDNTSPQLQTAWQQLKSRSLSVETIRQVDRTAVARYHMHSLVLMENAAIHCAQWLSKRFAPNSCGVVLCGRGNNGGDGLAIARHLRLAGMKIEIIQIGPLDRLSPDARCNWNILHAKNTVDCCLLDEQPSTTQLDAIHRQIASTHFVLDALLGSGAQGIPRAPISELIAMANSSSATRIAIDIPSGLDATTGLPASPTFRADTTLTFVARKLGFDKPSAQECLGQVEVFPIGIPVELVEELLNGSTDGQRSLI